MIKLGYEQKVKDIFVPNGTPPEVLSIMKSIDNPSDVFKEGCFIEQLGLQTPYIHKYIYLTLMTIRILGMMRIW